MTRFRFMGIVVWATLTFGVVVTAAHAEEAPSWSIGGTRLVKGKTHNISVKSVSTFEVSSPAEGSTIRCTALEDEKGVLLGSAAGEPGTRDEIVVFTGCTVTGNGTSCAIESPGANEIRTKPLKGELVEDSTGKKLQTLFSPSSGATFASIKFAGSTCKTKETVATGQVVAENTTDASPETTIELGQAKKEAHSWNVRFPETPIAEVTKYKAGSSEKVTVEEFTIFTDPAILSGVALLSLANTKFEAEANGPLWSPLP